MIRKVKVNEIPKLYPFVYKIFSDMELSVLDEINEELLKKIVVEAMHEPNYRYGYEHTWVCERDGEIAGAFFGYPGKFEPLVNGPLEASMVKHGLPADTIPQEVETISGEWYLDTLVTAPNFRRQGVGRKMMTAAEEIAKEAGYNKISLNCDIDNTGALQLYTHSGFEKKTQIVLSNHVYWHMVKQI